MLTKHPLDLQHSGFLCACLHERHLIVGIAEGQRTARPLPAVVQCRMSIEPVADLSQFRMTLFVGPQPVQGKPFTHSTVYNVKKRSWKGGVQVSVELEQPQIDQLSAAIGFSQWLEAALAGVLPEEQTSYRERAEELLVQALSWCKLDLLLQSGITQKNQCLTADTFVAELNDIAVKKRDFITSHVATELDLLSHNPPS
jgi:hypothetical protein